MFLDRDGTLNVKADVGDYIVREEDVTILPGVGAAIAGLNESGIRCIVVTNQRCVALGMANMEQVARVNRRIGALLRVERATIDGFLVCPHDLASCDCRKPSPGLLLRGLALYPEVTPEEAWMVGDEETDVAAGRSIGMNTIRLAPTGVSSQADYTVVGLPEAAEVIRAAGAEGVNEA